MTTITGKNLAFRIKEHTIFEQVSLQCDPGTLTALTGPSGCGKTSLLNVLGLLAPASSGEVYIDQVPTSGWNDKQRSQFWQQRAAFIYQDYGIIDDETVAYNVTLRPQAKTRGDVKAVLAQVGLQDRITEIASVLSGGEKQRLGVARAIFKQADVLFADEPTASLDQDNRRLIMELLRQRADTGVTVIISTHDQELIDFCDHEFPLG
ncbi:MAG: ATP-binding cassette domain-containing protein [Propionibacteriaceae bacterium]|nr:ATP-binding cassette domain-containing protein [Propionibacteriaceae bacterium]